MDAKEIVKEWAENKVIEKMVAKFSIKHPDDLAQQLYLELLEMDEEKIVNMYMDKTYRFFISRLVTNNVLSTNSRYYRQQEIYTSSRFPALNEAIFGEEYEEYKENEEFNAAWEKLSNIEQRVLIMHTERNKQDIMLALNNEFKIDITQRFYERYTRYCYQKLNNLLKGYPVKPFGPIIKENTIKKTKPIYCKNILTGKVSRFKDIYDAVKHTKLQKQTIWNLCNSTKTTPYKHKFYFSYKVFR